ncbi:sensor histidine kinase [Paenibacillus sp. BC26]|uniref:sensor histidine kinase n=1 Tax=Paenibacillus sp. BC26 TaxID=1881032 RepID=UPI0008EB5491|nr:sensor histidine kinase [Paenibacillus sp. BC26]SFT21763.1 two-component system, sensor histidine kinase YesM [Paenibacillus sp. BC26]
MNRLKLRKLRIGIVKKMIIGYVVIILLPTICIGLLYYKQIHNNALKDFANNREYFIQQFGSSLTMNMNQIEMIHDIFQTNKVLSGLLSGKYKTESEQVNVYLKELVPLFSFYKSNSFYIDQIRIYKSDPNVRNMGTSIVDSDGSIPSRATGLKVGEGYWLQEMSTPSALQMIYYKKLYNEDFSRAIGLMEIRLKYTFLSSMFHSSDVKGTPLHYYMAEDSNPRKGITHTEIVALSAKLPLSSPDKIRIYSAVQKSKSLQYMDSELGLLMMNSFYVPRLSSTILTVTPTSELFQKTQNSVQFYLLMISALLLILSCAYFFTVSTVVQRIVKLGKHMRGNLLAKYKEEQDSDEIAFLVSSYNKMIDRNDELMSKVDISQLRQKEAAYLALQAQINPHFIYNGLEAIRMAAEESDSPDVAKMIYALGQSIRYSLSKSQYVVLRDELSHIRSYLQIYKVRMEERLQYEIEVEDESLLRIACPRFIIQPLVENAIVHGISKKRGTGTLRIRLYSEGPLALVRIQDDGAGITPERLEMLRQKLDGIVSMPEPEQEQGGIGVMNVHERMISHFGPAYGLTIASEPGEGTTITLSMPKEGNAVEAPHR